MDLGHTVVRAPVDGVISQRNVELGQVAQAGQPLLAVVDLDNVWVTANYKENQLENMRPGQKAVVSVDAYGGGRTGAMWTASRRGRGRSSACCRLRTRRGIT